MTIYRYLARLLAPVMFPLLAVLSAVPSAEVWLERPLSLPVVIATPSETRGPVSAQDIREALEVAVRRTVGCEIHQIDSEVLRGCGGAVGCVLAHKEMERAAQEKGPALPGQHALWLTAVATERSVSISGFFFDLARARSVLSANKDGDVVEAAAVLIVPPELVRDSSELGAYLDRLVGEELRPVFSRLGAGKPLGSVRVEGMTAAAEVLVGGRAIGELSEGGLIRGLPFGEWVIELRPQELEGTRASVNVDSAQVVLEASFRVPTVARARSLTAWGGIALLVTGVAVTTAGSIAVASHERVTCVGAVAGDCYLIPISVPVGVGIAGAGLGAFSGEAVFGEWNDWPWPAWVLSAVAGVAAGVIAGVAR